MIGTKAELRVALVTARRNVTQAGRRAEANALAAHVANLVTGTDTVCAYVPVGTEPGSVAMLDAAVGAGARVLLPVARTDTDGAALPLRWGVYRPNTLVAASFGLREPPDPHLPAATIAEADAILVPALAVDRRGVRLGRGAGFYDRSLPLAAPTARRIAIVRDDELLEHVPSEPHDVRMTHALLPRAGLITF